MSKYLITGGAGFIGSNLAESILRAGDDVSVLDNFASGRRSNLEQTSAWAAEGSSRFELHEGDIRNPEDCDAATRGVDYVLHLAAAPSVQRSVKEPVFTNSVNIVGTLNLLEAARTHSVKRFVFASSSSIYGESESLPKVETMPSAPISPYGLQKLAGESYVRMYHRLYGLPTVALRYFNVFGPRQDPNSDYAAVIPLFIKAAQNSAPSTVFGDGEQTRDFTYIQNVVSANLLACSSPETVCGEAYNIACGDRISLNQLLGRIAEIVGHEVPAKYLEPRAGDIKHSQAGIDLAQSRLGYAPAINLGEGLRRTIEAS